MCRDSLVNLGLEPGAELVRRPYPDCVCAGRAVRILPQRGARRSADAVASPTCSWRARLGRAKAPGFFHARLCAAVSRHVVRRHRKVGSVKSFAMLRSHEAWQRFERIVLVHGARRVEHLSYAEELAELAAAHPSRFKRVSVLSGDTHGAALPGRVTTVFADGSLEACAEMSLDPERSHLMLCGNPDMIVELSALLATRGLRKHRVRTPGHISAEKYW